MMVHVLAVMILALSPVSGPVPEQSVPAAEDTDIFGCKRSVFEATKITSSRFFDGRTSLTFGRCETTALYNGRSMNGLLIIDARTGDKVELLYPPNAIDHVLRTQSLRLVDADTMRHPVTLAKTPAVFYQRQGSGWLADNTMTESRQIAIIDTGFCGSNSIFVRDGVWEMAFFPGVWRSEFFVLQAIPQPVVPDGRALPFFGCDRKFFEDTKITTAGFFDAPVPVTTGLCRKMKTVDDPDYSAAIHAYDLLVLDRDMTTLLDRVNMGDDWPAYWTPPTLGLHPFEWPALHEDGQAPQPYAALAPGLAGKNVTSSRMAHISSVHCTDGEQGREKQFFVHQSAWWQAFRDW